MSLKVLYWNAIRLGAINGITFGVFFEITLRSIFLYESYIQKQTSISSDMHIHTTSYPFSWWFLPILSLVFITLASFLANQYLAHRIKSIFWLWQIIGFIAVLECYLYGAIMSCWEWYRFDFVYVEDVMRAMYGNLITCLRVLPIVLVFNLLFAIALRFRKPLLP